MLELLDKVCEVLAEKSLAGNPSFASVNICNSRFCSRFAGNKILWSAHIIDFKVDSM